MESLKKIKTFIDDNESFLVTSHVNPDGDAVASMLLMVHLLSCLGKRAAAVIDDAVPRKFDYLHGIERIITFGAFDATEPHDGIIVVDASSPERTGRLQTLIESGTPVINIDHHASNTRFGDFNFIDPGASSSAELAHQVFSNWPCSVTPEIASIVYSGIVCDTGRFLFPNTTAAALALCSSMVEKGARPDEIAGNLYHRNSQNTVHALADALSTLEFHFNGSVACIYLANAQGEDIDTEGFVDHLLSIEGTEVQIFMIEKAPGEYRISMRSKSHIDVNAVAHHFGGGGHIRAAGCVVRGSREEIQDRLLQVLGEQLCTV